MKSILAMAFLIAISIAIMNRIIQASVNMTKLEWMLNKLSLKKL